jgi:uncharacterized protein YjbJ (UPF0337 family)
VNGCDAIQHRYFNNTGIAMNWDQIEGKWSQYKGQAQKKWGKLTDDELEVVLGRREELAGRIQAAYGKTKEEVDEEIDRWCEKL